MASVHGKDTVITVATKDISPYTDDSNLDRGADVHDNTGYGKQAHTHGGGLLKATFECSGTYDNTAVTGPRAALRPLVGTMVACVRKPEGTGTGKPNEAFNAILESYKESNPVADFVKWAAKFTVSDVIVDTTQA